jgi:hypothetical protein
VLSPEEIAWALERLADGDYEFIEDDNSRAKRMIIAEPEWFPEKLEFEILAYMEGPESLQDFERNPSPATLRRLLDNVMDLSAESREMLATELSGASYEYVVEAIYRETRRLDGVSDHHWLRRKETGVATRLGGEIHRVPLGPDHQAEGMITGAYARDLAWAFPKIIRDAQSLLQKPVAPELPPMVGEYLYEASKCFVYRRDMACVAVCRSTLELALRDLLEREDKEVGERGLGLLIKAAEPLARWKVKQGLDLALPLIRSVNEMAKPVVHPQTQVDHGIAREVLLETREALRLLYA